MPADKLKDVIEARIDSSRSASEIANEAINNVIRRLGGSKGDGDKRRRRVVDNFVAIMGAAGGVGTSTIVANVAKTLANQGLHVLVIDTNIQYPAMQTFFKIQQEIDKKDLVSFIMGRNVIGESIEQCGSISVMCANNRTLVDSANCDTAKCSENLFGALDSVRELFDVILFDCCNDLSADIVNMTMFRADAIYLVWDEGISSIANTDRIRRNMYLTGIEAEHKVRVVMNKRTNVHYSKYPLKELGLELVTVLPFDTAVIESGLRGDIFVSKGESTSKNAAAFASGIGVLAGKILEVGGYGR